MISVGQDVHRIYENVGSWPEFKKQVCDQLPDPTVATLRSRRSATA